MEGLVIEGEVESPCSLTFNDLASLPDQIDDLSTVVPGRTGGAVRLRAIFERVSVAPEATHLTCESSEGGFAASVPLEAVRAAVVAYRLGDGPLPADLGGPLRFFIPQVDECARGEVDPCANVKYLARLRLTRGPGRDTRPTTKREHEELHERED